MEAGTDRYRAWELDLAGERFTVRRGRANRLFWSDEEGDELFWLESATIVGIMLDEQWLTEASGGKQSGDLSPVERKCWVAREGAFAFLATTIFGIYKQGQLRGQAVGRLQAQTSMRLALGIRSVDLDSRVDVLCGKVEDLETAMDEVVRRQEK